MRFVDTTFFWKLQSFLDENFPLLRRIPVQALYEKHPLTASNLLHYLPQLERFCKNNKCVNCRLAGIHEWYALSSLNLLRNHPRQHLLTQLINLGVVTSPKHKRLSGNSIYAFAGIALDVCALPQFDRRAMFLELETLLQDIPLPDNLASTLEQSILESVKERHFPTHCEFEGVAIGTKDSKKYDKNMVLLADAYCENFIDEDGVMRDDNLYHMVRSKHELLRITSENLIGQPGHIQYQISIPVMFKFRLSSGRRVASVENISIIRIVVITPQANEYTTLCTSTMLTRLHVKELNVTIPSFTLFGLISHILHPERNEEVIALQTAALLIALEHMLPNVNCTSRINELFDLHSALGGQTVRLPRLLERFTSLFWMKYRSLPAPDQRLLLSNTRLVLLHSTNAFVLSYLLNLQPTYTPFYIGPYYIENMRF